MKTNALLAFFFFFAALFAFTTAELVYQSDGELLNNGGKYYFLPANIGGLATVGARIEKGHGACSLAVVEKLLFRNGWPTKIASPLLTLHISTDYPLWISFAYLPLDTCTENPQWLVTREPGFGYPVMVGDAKEFPHPFSGRFFIKPYDSEKYHYKLVFCHEQEVDCGHVGLKTDSHGNERLVVTKEEEPYAFKFVKATSDDDDVAAASDISMVV